MNPILEVENISTWYPQIHGFFRHVHGWTKACTDVSFHLKKEEILGIIGESGSGKTTLARTIMRLVPSTKGKILFDGIDITTMDEKKLKPIRKKIQMVFQHPQESLNPKFSIFQTIDEVLTFFNIYSFALERLEYIKFLLHTVGLDQDVLYRFPHELSIGQLQRVSLARALSTNPEVLVLDECVSSLDVSVQAQILNLLFDLQQKEHLSYVFISHDLSVVQHMCDYVLVMHQGLVVEKGPLEEVFSNPQAPYTQKLLSAAL